MERYPLPQRQGADSAGLIPCVALAEYWFGLKFSVELEQRLIQQRRHILLDPLAADNGVKGGILVVGHREDGGMFRFLRLLHRFLRSALGLVEVPVHSLLRLLRLFRQRGAARQKQQRQQQRRKPSTHGLFLRRRAR